MRTIPDLAVFDQTPAAWLPSSVLGHRDGEMLARVKTQGAPGDCQTLEYKMQLLFPGTTAWLLDLKQGRSTFVLPTSRWFVREWEFRAGGAVGPTHFHPSLFTQSLSSMV